MKQIEEESVKVENGKTHFADQSGLLAFIRLPLGEVNPAAPTCLGYGQIIDIALFPSVTLVY